MNANQEAVMHCTKKIYTMLGWGIVLLGLAGNLLASQESVWIPLQSGVPESTPEIRLLQSDGLRTVIEITLPGFYQQTIEEQGITYQKLMVDDNLAGHQVGSPDLPVMCALLGLPPTGTVSARIINREVETLSGYRLYPFQEPLKDNQNQSSFTIDQTVYQQNRDYPSELVSLDGPNIWRDCRVVSVRVTPFRYNPVSNQLKVYRKLTVEITATPGAGPNPLDGDHHLVSPTFDRMYRASILNYDDLGYQLRLTDTPSTKYLIITNTTAVSHVQPIVDFRNAQGYKVEVRTISSPDFDDPAEFKAYIRTLYLDGGLEYVLMVGDFGTGDHNVPMYYWNPDGSDPSYSDSWYSCLVPGDDNDHYAEIAIGRIVYDNHTELDFQISKLMNYLRNPDTSTNWAEHTLLVAHQEEYPQKYTLCKNQIAGFTYSLQQAIFDSVYGGNGGTNTQVVNYINNTGCGILNYRGHGSDLEWWQWGPSGSLTATQVNQMTNANHLFVHFDVCCDNMNIVNYPGNCLAESFMKAPYAAVAINGAIIPSYTIPNHDYDKEMYKAVYHVGIYNIGYVTNYANITVLNVHGSLGRSNARTYLWLGDACIDVWTNTPRPLTVQHSPVHLIGVSTYSVDVSQSSTPVQNAMVCAQNEEVYAVGYTDATGHVTLQFEEAPTIPDTLKLMVTKHNCLTYEANVSIIPPSGAYISYESHSLNDAAGNNNGLADYGEHILLNLTLRNVGTETANDVLVTLTTPDPYITITDSTQMAGNISPSGSVTLTNAFAFDVSPDAPDLYPVSFQITMQDSMDTIWGSNFSLSLHAPVISIQSVVVNDATGGNNNGRLDPGESAHITVTLSNNGSSAASTISSLLTSDHNYLTVNQGSANLSNLPASGTGTLTPDYVLQLSSSCPSPSLAILYFNLTGDRNLHKNLLYELSLGGFFDNMESGVGTWTHSPVNTGWADQWHQSTEMSYSPTHSWKCGDTGTGNYTDHMDAALYTSVMNLPLGCKLHFNHWMYAETSSYYPDSAYDGGIIEISVHGGAWTLITPEGGYNKTVRWSAGGGNPSTSPFPGSPCFSGTIDWTPVTVDLSSYSGNIQIRFRFGSDNATNREGWYVDDVSIDLEITSGPPTNLAASLQGNTANLTWASPGAFGMIASLQSYNIYRQGIRIDSLIYNNHYQDDLTGMTPGNYTYQVSAQYSAGESALSNPAVVYYTPGLNPIQNLVIKRQSTNVYLFWSAIPGATLYKVYRSTEPFTGFTLRGTTSAHTFQDSGVVGVKYFYQVTATNE
jgi:hypothetical protein